MLWILPPLILLDRCAILVSFVDEKTKHWKNSIINHGLNQRWFRCPCSWGLWGCYRSPTIQLYWQFGSLPWSVSSSFSPSLWHLTTKTLKPTGTMVYVSYKSCAVVLWAYPDLHFSPWRPLMTSSPGLDLTVKTLTRKPLKSKWVPLIFAPSMWMKQAKPFNQICSTTGQCWVRLPRLSSTPALPVKDGTWVEPSFSSLTWDPTSKE